MRLHGSLDIYRRTRLYCASTPGTLYFAGGREVISSLLLAVQSTTPNTGADLSINKIIIIGISSLLALFIIPRVVRYPQVGPKMPIPLPSLFNNPSVGTFLAAMSTGHLIGVGAVLGLTNLGRL